MDQNKAAEALEFQIKGLERWIKIFKDVITEEELRAARAVLKGLRDLQVALRLSYLKDA